MRQSSYQIAFILLVIAQILICNYLNLTQYIMLSILPVLILCLPVRVSTLTATVIAFASGICVDLLSDGLVGLNCLALVPVAFCRKAIISLVFGSEVFARKENIATKKHGIGKMAFGIVLVQSLFLIIYIWADGAATRPFWFNLVRFLLSLIVSSALSLYIAGELTEDRLEKWN